MNRYSHALILTLGLTAGLAAQVKDQPAEAQQPATLWQLQIGGIGGWSAAKKASKARDVLRDIDGIESLAVDTTARAFFRSNRSKKELSKEIAGVLKDSKMKLAKLTKSKVKIPVEVYHIEVKGLGWQSTAKSIRGMLEKQKGVTVAMPFADAGRVEVWASKRQALTEKSAKDVIELGKFKVLAFAAKPYSAGAESGKKKGAKKGAKRQKDRVGAGGNTP